MILAIERREWRRQQLNKHTYTNLTNIVQRIAIFKLNETITDMYEFSRTCLNVAINVSNHMCDVIQQENSNHLEYQNKHILIIRDIIKRYHNDCLVAERIDYHKKNYKNVEN
jgi:hypothetical protein